MPTTPQQIVPLPTPSLGRTTVRIVHRDDILEKWPKVRELILSAMDEDYLECDAVKFLLHGAWDLWVIEKEDEVVSVCVTEIIDFPRRRKCFLRFAAGKLEALNQHENEMTRFAIQHGCSSLQTFTRKGMARAKPEWKQTYIVLEKEL